MLPDPYKYSTSKVSPLSLPKKTANTMMLDLAVLPYRSIQYASNCHSHSHMSFGCTCTVYSGISNSISSRISSRIFSRISSRIFSLRCQGPSLCADNCYSCPALGHTPVCRCFAVFVHAQLWQAHSTLNAVASNRAVHHEMEHVVIRRKRPEKKCIPFGRSFSL